MNLNELLKTKTFWTGLAGLLTAIGGYATGDLAPAVAIQTGLISCIGIFLRDALTKQ
ncbi:MAG: hypothetical protein AB1641_09845 [Thermodesulfobacteriota bacterium]